MKTMRLLMAAALCLSAGSGALWAQDIEAQIISQLQSQGYVRITVTRTWLGRVRIEAEGPGREREIIFNPTTGEILRDYWEVDDDDYRGGGGGIPSTSSGSGEDDDDDDDDEGGPGGGDDDDDDDDDDGGDDDDDDD